MINGNSSNCQPGGIENSSGDVFGSRMDNVLHTTDVANVPTDVNWGRSFSWHSEDQELMFAMSDIDDSDPLEGYDLRIMPDMSTGTTLVSNVIDQTSDQSDLATEVDSGKGNSGCSDGILQHFEFSHLPAP
jgi:hypothetical protein